MRFLRGYGLCVPLFILGLGLAQAETPAERIDTLNLRGIEPPTATVDVPPSDITYGENAVQHCYVFPTFAAFETDTGQVGAETIRLRARGNGESDADLCHAPHRPEDQTLNDAQGYVVGAAGPFLAVSAVDSLGVPGGVAIFSVPDGRKLIDVRRDTAKPLTATLDNGVLALRFYQPLTLNCDPSEEACWPRTLKQNHVPAGVILVRPQCDGQGAPQTFRVSTPVRVPDVTHPTPIFENSQPLCERFGTQALMEPLAVAHFGDRGSPSAFASFFRLWKAQAQGEPAYAFAGGHSLPDANNEAPQPSDVFHRLTRIFAKARHMGPSGTPHSPARLELIRHINAFKRYFDPHSVYAVSFDDETHLPSLIRLIRELRHEVNTIPDLDLREAIQDLEFPLLDRLEEASTHWMQDRDTPYVVQYEELNNLRDSLHAVVADILNGMIAWPADELLPRIGQHVDYDQLAAFGRARKSAAVKLPRKRLQRAIEGFERLSHLDPDTAPNLQPLYESTLDLLTPAMQDLVEDSLLNMTDRLNEHHQTNVTYAQIRRSPLASLVALSMLVVQALHKEAWDPNLLAAWNAALAEYNRQSDRFAPHLPHVEPAGALSLGLSGYWPTTADIPPRAYTDLLDATKRFPTELQARFLAIQLMQLSWHNTDESFDQRLVDRLLPRAYALLDRGISPNTQRALRDAIGFIWLHYDTRDMRQMIWWPGVKATTRAALRAVEQAERQGIPVGGIYFEFGTQLFSYGWPEPVDEIVLNLYGKAGQTHAAALRQKASRASYMNPQTRHVIYEAAYAALANPKLPLRDRQDNAIHPAPSQLLREQS